jgi:hypothetical protein
MRKKLLSKGGVAAILAALGGARAAVCPGPAPDGFVYITNGYDCCGSAPTFRDQYCTMNPGRGCFLLLLLFFFFFFTLRLNLMMSAYC